MYFLKTIASKNVNKRLLKYLLYLAIFFSLQQPNIVHSCNINNLLIARKNILKELNEPDDTLLILNNNSLSLIAKKLSSYKIKKSANQNINIFQLTPNGPVLKNITKITKLIDLEKFNKKSEYTNASSVIVGSNDVYLFNNKRIKSKEGCTDNIYYFKKISSSNYSYNNKGKEILLTKNQILNIILNNPDNLNKVANEILLEIKSGDMLSTVRTINQKINKNISSVRNIKLETVALGAQMSEAVIPFSSFQLANYLKDGNALHYLSQFKASKEPRLIIEKPSYAVGLKFNQEATNLKLSINYPINEKTKINIGTELNKNSSNLTETYVSNSRFIGKNNHFLVRFGKMNSKDFGLLLSNQNFNLQNESVISLTGFSAFNSNCSSCIESALTTGIEKYYSPWRLNIAGNYIIQNISNKTENLTEIGFKKEFKSKKSISLKIRHNLANNFSSEFDIVYKIPIGTNTSRLNGSTDSYLEYGSNSTDRITNWTRKQSDIIFKNTPNYLKRNWNTYMNFN